MKFKTNIKNKKILVDTNIWLFLFAPNFIPSNENQSKIDKYDRIFNNLLEDNELLFNSLIISEFINRCLRIDFQLKFPNKNFKKDYRNSKEYKIALNLTLKQVEKIYKLATPINDDFMNFNIKEFRENLDFNDSIILYQCIKNDYLLLTDDKDFENYINTRWWF